MSDVRSDLTRIIGDLRQLWKAALWLQAGRETWHAISNPLTDYSNASWMIWGWYRDSTLAGCRRLVDDRRGSLSVVRSLGCRKSQHPPRVSGGERVGGAGGGPSPSRNAKSLH